MPGMIRFDLLAFLFLSLSVDWTNMQARRRESEKAVLDHDGGNLEYLL